MAGLRRIKIGKRRLGAGRGKPRGQRQINLGKRGKAGERRGGGRGLLDWEIFCYFAVEFHGVKGLVGSWMLI